MSISTKCRVPLSFPDMTKPHLVRKVLSAAGLLIALGGMSAQASPWEPAPPLKQLRIWPGAGPHAQRNVGGGEAKLVTDKLVAGKPWTYIDGVSQPAITVYPAKGKNTGAAVLIFPGGGYQILAID